MSVQRALGVKNVIDNSVQMQYLRELERLSELTIRNLRPPRFFATHSSTKANLHVDKKVVYTEWAGSVNWSELNKDVMLFVANNFIDPVVDEMMQYMKLKIDLSLSPFDPVIWINNLKEYGKNDGSWSDIIWREFSGYIQEYLKQMTWTDEVLSETKRDIDNWDDLVLNQPMFSILRHSATSAYPDYTKQSTKFIVNKYAEAIDAEIPNFVTSYHRRHGYSRKIDERSKRVTIIEKDRWVGGVPFIAKVHGLPLTYSFKQSKPDFTPYYKPWDMVFSNLLNKYKNNQEHFVFTSDQSGFDMNHNTLVIRDTMKLVTDTMPNEMAKYTTGIMNACYNNPKLIMNARYYVRLGRWISTSGAPPTPLFETLNNLALHRYALNKMGEDPLSLLVQIDDTVAFMEREIDLEQFSKIVRDDLGFIINPDKTETNLKGYIVYLQILVGKLLKQLTDLETVTGIKWDDGFGYIGHIMRRLHRLRFKERMMQVAGDVIFYDEEGTDVSNKPVSRFIGSISSLGPMTPTDLIDIIVYHHMKAYYYEDNKKHMLMDEVIDFCKSKALTFVGEFGFDPKPHMLYLAKNY